MQEHCKPGSKGGHSNDNVLSIAIDITVTLTVSRCYESSFLIAAKKVNFWGGGGGGVGAERGGTIGTHLRDTSA